MGAPVSLKALLPSTFSGCGWVLITSTIGLSLTLRMAVRMARPWVTFTPVSMTITPSGPTMKPLLMTLPRFAGEISSCAPMKA